MQKLTTAALLAALTIGSVAPALANDVNIEANGQTYAFKPAVVMLKKGQATTLHFKATPGAPHGLNVPELGIKNIVITSAGTNVKVKPMKAGTYAAHCTIVCGSGHAHMAMKFIVK
jgi:cytochrome c oxidase subunit 2